MFFLQESLNEIKKQGLWRQTRLIPRDSINFCSNDYLGLSHHARVLHGALQAARRYGTGSGAARLVSGNTDMMEILESEIAQWKRVGSAVLFNSGYHANIGVIPALMGEKDVIFSDALNHASIVDGCRLSKAKTLIYRHNDMGHLESLLKGRVSQKASRRLLVTESVFSMEGDLASLEDLKDLASRYQAFLYVDEAHAVGILGRKGTGRSETGAENLLTLGTFGKAFGSYGAFVCGSDVLKKYLMNKARSFIFSTSLPPAAIGASLAALKIVRGPEGERLRRELWSNVDLVNQELGLDQGTSPIFSIRIGDARETMRISERLLRDGIHIQGIRPPTVPEGTSRLRLTVSATHTVGQIAQLISSLKALHS